MIVTLFSTSHSRSLSNGPRWIRALGEIRATAILQTALATLCRSGSHLARLIDDHGHTQAVIALEDILDELVGEVIGPPGGQTLQTKSTVF